MATYTGFLQLTSKNSKAAQADGDDWLERSVKGVDVLEGQIDSTVGISRSWVRPRRGPLDSAPGRITSASLAGRGWKKKSSLRRSRLERNQKKKKNLAPPPCCRGSLSFFKRGILPPVLISDREVHTFHPMRRAYKVRIMHSHTHTQKPISAPPVRNLPFSYSHA